MQKGIELYNLMERLFPICRSLTGNGVRETLNIVKEFIPINIHEEPSGKRVFDWEIPNEWNIQEAYVKNSEGKKVIDFKKNNLHVVGYSEPFEGKISLDELDKHLFSLPDQPNLIPYITSYYKRMWGFCLSHNERSKLKDGTYYVKIDSSLKQGFLTYGDMIVKGKVDDEILISTYICHPSMANNELSGPVISTFLAKYILEQIQPYYSYRFVFIPETIGSILYLHKHKDKLIKNVKSGYVVTCIGDNGDFSYLKTRAEDQLVDRISIHVLKHLTKNFKTYDFTHRGSDERQYNSPGIDLPIGSLMRTKYGKYPEYHTSGDNMGLISPKSLYESLKMYQMMIKAFENNKVYKTTVLCEPQLGKRGLYPTISTKESNDQVKNMMDLLAYCDGSKDLLWIAEKIEQPIFSLIDTVEMLKKNKLITVID